jgi:hypothetical protein
VFHRTHKLMHEVFHRDFLNPQLRVFTPFVHCLPLPIRLQGSGSVKRVERGDGLRSAQAFHSFSSTVPLAFVSNPLISVETISSSLLKNLVSSCQVV